MYHMKCRVLSFVHSLYNSTGPQDIRLQTKLTAMLITGLCYTPLPVIINRGRVRIALREELLVRVRAREVRLSLGADHE